MQLASDAYSISNPGLSFGGSGGECRLAFPSDMPTIKQDDPDVGVREVTAPDGGVATLARSTAMVLKPLEDSLEEGILPPETPDDQCLKLTLRNEDGKVAEVKCKKPVEIISDPNHPLVLEWMKNHGVVGTAGYLPWHGPGVLRTRHQNADFAFFQGE